MRSLLYEVQYLDEIQLYRHTVKHVSNFIRIVCCCIMYSS